MDAFSRLVRCIPCLVCDICDRVEKRDERIVQLSVVHEQAECPFTVIDLVENRCSAFRHTDGIVHRCIRLDGDRVKRFNAARKQAGKAVKLLICFPQPFLCLLGDSDQTLIDFVVGKEFADCPLARIHSMEQSIQFG